MFWHCRGPPFFFVIMLQFCIVRMPKKWRARCFQTDRAKLKNVIPKCRVPFTTNPTCISRMCMQKDGVEMYAKLQNLGRCYTLFWGKNCALALRQTLQDEFLKVQTCVYLKRYTKGFVNPSKPFAHALHGIMFCSC